MAKRVSKQYEVRGQLHVLPPWPHDEVVKPSVGANPFQLRYNGDERFLVMYSGNHSPASPVTTLLAAALRLQGDPRFLFMFVGGGQGKREVDEAIRLHAPCNILSLPYQPLETLHESLGAADIHAVTLGDQMAGIIHPCKIYGAMAVGRAILFIGPRPSHAADLIEKHQIGWHVNHGDVVGMVAALQAAAALSPDERAAIGDRARAAATELYNKRLLCDAVCNLVGSLGPSGSVCSDEDEVDSVPVGVGGSGEAATGSDLRTDWR